MSRTVRDATLESRTARGRLEPRGEPYYRAIEHGLHLGYRKSLAGAGKWLVRHYVGNSRYRYWPVGIADDFSDADGRMILSFKQAQVAARKLLQGIAPAGMPLNQYVAGKALDFLARDVEPACYLYLIITRAAICFTSASRSSRCTDKIATSRKQDGAT